MGPRGRESGAAGELSLEEDRTEEAAEGRWISDTREVGPWDGQGDTRRLGPNRGPSLFREQGGILIEHNCGSFTLHCEGFPLNSKQCL